MKITNEILAAYAEGKVSQAERVEVRRYLMKHPRELESVMMMMDEDYELDAAQDELNHTSIVSCEKGSLPFSDISLSAAAFVPSFYSGAIRHENCDADISSARKDTFGSRLDNLMKELF